MGGKFEWPPIKDVVDYRRNVRQMILKIIDETPLSLPITRDSPWVCAFVIFCYHSESYEMLSRCPSQLSSVKM